MVESMCVAETPERPNLSIGMWNMVKMFILVASSAQSAMWPNSV